MERVQELSLDIGTDTDKKYVFVKHGNDETRFFLKIRFLKNGERFVPNEGSTAMFCCEKSSWHSYVSKVEISEDGTVAVSFTDRVLSCQGLTRASVILIKDDKAMATATFYIDEIKASDVSNKRRKEREW